MEERSVAPQGHLFVDGELAKTMAKKRAKKAKEEEEEEEEKETSGSRAPSGAQDQQQQPQQQQQQNSAPAEKVNKLPCSTVTLWITNDRAKTTCSRMPS